MRFDERREPEFLRDAEVLFEFRSSEQGANEEHRRSAEFPRLVDEIGVHREILPDTGKRDRCRNLAEIAVIPEKPLRLGQHRDTGSPGRLIGLCDFEVGKVLGNHAL